MNILFQPFIKKCLLSGAILLWLASGVFADDSLRVFRRTGLYVEIGGPGYLHLNGNLEHYFINGKWAHIGGRLGYGIWNSWSGEGSETIVTTAGQFGRKRHFAEVQTGALFYTDRTKNNSSHPGPTPIYTVPMISAGYVFRWKHLQLKANVNSKLTINAGIGLVF